MWMNTNLKVPYLITCPIAFKNRIPVAVSLTEKACDFATNKLKVINNQPPNGVKKSFMVCIKYLFVENRSGIIKFIEWVQLLRILGVDKISLYNRHVHPEFFKMLLYFQEKDYIEMFDFLEPSGLSTNNETQEVRSLEGRIQKILVIIVCLHCSYCSFANFF